MSFKKRRCPKHEMLQVDSRTANDVRMKTLKCKCVAILLRKTSSITLICCNFKESSATLVKNLKITGFSKLRLNVQKTRNSNAKQYTFFSLKIPRLTTPPKIPQVLQIACIIIIFLFGAKYLNSYFSFCDNL